MSSRYQRTLQNVIISTLPRHVQKPGMKTSTLLLLHFASAADQTTSLGVPTTSTSNSKGRVPGLARSQRKCSPREWEMSMRPIYALCHSWADIGRSHPTRTAAGRREIEPQLYTRLALTGPLIWRANGNEIW
jgi:hypothetical protein